MKISISVEKYISDGTFKTLFSTSIVVDDLSSVPFTSIVSALHYLFPEHVVQFNCFKL